MYEALYFTGESERMIKLSKAGVRVEPSVKLWPRVQSESIAHEAIVPAQKQFLIIDLSKIKKRRHSQQGGSEGPKRTSNFLSNYSYGWGPGLIFWAASVLSSWNYFTMIPATFHMHLERHNSQ